MSDPFTAAWEEAEASVPPGKEPFSTLELQHPAFINEDEEEEPVRIVAGTPDDQLFTIEDGADFNGGEIVKFQACPFYADPPSFAEGKMPEVQVTVDNVARHLIPKLEAAVQINADLVVTFRQYSPDDRTEPCYGPVSFVMRNVVITGASVTGTAQLDNLANSKFPSKVYNATQFPGLVP
jgi:hypothetical protein